MRSGRINLLVGVLWLITGAGAQPEGTCKTISRELNIKDLDDPEKMKELTDFLERHAQGKDVSITTHIHEIENQETNGNIPTVPNSSVQTATIIATDSTTSTPKTVANDSPTSVPTTEETDTPTDSCKSNPFGGCYWLEGRASVNFTQAKQICEEKGSEIAQIHNEKDYNSTVDLIRLSKASDSPEFWVDMNVSWMLENSSMHNTHNLNTTGRSANHTRAFIKVPRTNLWQGMKNSEPDKQLEGVVCWVTQPNANTPPCHPLIPSNHPVYCIVIRDTRITFDEARNVCKDRGGSIAPIPDDETYMAIVKDIRKITDSSDRTRTRVWINALWDYEPKLPGCQWQDGYPKIMNGVSGISVTFVKWKPQLKNRPLSDMLESALCSDGDTADRCIDDDETFNYTAAVQLCNCAKKVIADADYILQSCNRTFQTEEGKEIWTSANITWTSTLYRKWFDGFPKDESNRTHLYLDVQGSNFRNIQTLLGKPTNKKNGVVCWRSDSAKCPSNYSVWVHGKGCFWVNISRIITYDTAVNICKTKDAEIAKIPDKSTFDDIVEVLRFVDEISGSKQIWVDMDVKWIARTQPCRGAFYKWYTGYPQRINGPVSISVTDNETGMKNHPNSESLDGVLCWKPYKGTHKSPLNYYNTFYDEDQHQHYYTWIEIQTGNPLVNLSEAENICQQNNAAIATVPEIVTRHYESIGDLISKDLLMNRAVVWIRKYEKGPDETLLSGGEVSTSSEHMLMVIDKNDCNSTLENANATVKAHGVVCLRNSP